MFFLKKKSHGNIGRHMEGNQDNQLLPTWIRDIGHEVSS
jgi:hypothetical protein